MISEPRFQRYLGTDSMQATQNFSIGVILDAKSDGIEIFGNSKTLPFVGMKSDFNHLLNFIGVLDFKNIVFTGTNFEPIKNA